MRYPTAFLDHVMVGLLDLPCPGTGVEEPPVVDSLSLWGSAMFGADAVEESLGLVGAVLGPAFPHPGAVADDPHAMVVGGDHGDPPNHESDSSPASSKSSSSCESFSGWKGGPHGPSLPERRRGATSRTGPRGGRGRATQAQAAGSLTNSPGQARQAHSSGSGRPQWS